MKGMGPCSPCDAKSVGMHTLYSATSATYSSNSSENSSSSSKWSRKEKAASDLLRAKQARTVWIGRVVFVVTLAIAGGLLGWGAHRLLSDAEDELMQKQFQASAKSALGIFQANFMRKTEAFAIVKELFETSYSDEEAWPFVALPAFSTVVGSVLKAVDGCPMAFVPVVAPDQLEQFEDFAYSWYQGIDEYPEDLAESSFGRGVWGKDPTSTAPDQRYHDTNSSYYTPILQHSTGASPMLMMNLWTDATHRASIDAARTCVQNRGKPGHHDTSMSEHHHREMSENNADVHHGMGENNGDDHHEMNEDHSNHEMNGEIGHHDNGDDIGHDEMNVNSGQHEMSESCASIGHSFLYPVESLGPTSMVTQPIVISNKIVGYIHSRVSWGRILWDVDESLNGMSFILSSSHGTGHDGHSDSWTWNVENGVAVLQGRGEDFLPHSFEVASHHEHDHGNHMLGESIVMNAPGLFSADSATFTLRAVPTDVFCDIYTTSNPYIAMVGAVVIIILTSLFFAIYDYLVRRECNVRQQLLSAKREFMRFISHEVRTPLNR